MKSKHCSWMLYGAYGNTEESTIKLHKILNGWEIKPTKKSAMKRAGELADKTGATIEFFPIKSRARWLKGKGKNIRTFYAFPIDNL